MPKSKSSRKSRREVKKAMRFLDALAPDWRKHEKQMTELTKTIAGDGMPVDQYLLRLYAIAKKMDQPLVEIANA